MQPGMSASVLCSRNFAVWDGLLLCFVADDYLLLSQVLKFKGPTNITVLKLAIKQETSVWS